MLETASSRHGQLLLSWDWRCHAEYLSVGAEGLQILATIISCPLTHGHYKTLMAEIEGLRDRFLASRIV